MQSRRTNDLRGHVSRGAKWSGAFPLQRLSFEVGFVLSAQHAEHLVHGGLRSSDGQRLRDEAYVDLTSG